MSEENSSPISVEEAEEKVSARIYRRSLMLDHGTLDPRTLAHQFPGSGTDQDPYIVGWTANALGIHFFSKIEKNGCGHCLWRWQTWLWLWPPARIRLLRKN